MPVALKNLNIAILISHMFVAVYFPSCSNNNIRSEALNELFQHVSEQQMAHLDASLVLAGDFNNAGQQQRLCFPNCTKALNLDNVFTTQRGDYKTSSQVVQQQQPVPECGEE